MEARGMESQEEGPFPPRPLSSQPGQDGAVCCTFPRGWALPLWLRDGAFCLALGPLSLPGPPPCLAPLPPWPSLLLRGHKPAQQLRVLSVGPAGPGPSPCGCRWATLAECWASGAPAPREQ